MSCEDDMNDLVRERILNEVAEIAGNREAAERWLEQPLKTFDDKTPTQLILEGRARAVMRYLASVKSGFVG